MFAAALAEIWMQASGPPESGSEPFTVTFPPAQPTATDGPAVAVGCAGGNVTVNGSDPDSGGPLACIQISASAAANIDLTGVTAAAFPAASSQVNGSPGDDSYFLAGG